MRKVTTTLATLAACALLAGSAMASGPVRISQVYGGGGSAAAGPTYNKDYVEIFNAAAVAVDISGWKIEYGSATGNWGSSAGNIFTFPASTFIQPCSYILVASTTASAGGGTLPITPDFNFLIAASATSGKVALFTAANTNLPCGSELPGTLVDKLGFGPTSNCPETAAIGLLSTTTGAVRNAGGINDTDNNSADFTIVTAPVPRNSASPPNVACQPVPAQPSTWSGIKGIRH